MTIPRYSRPEMAAIWSPETRFRIWFEIEAHAADAMAELGMIPKAAAKKIWAKGKAAQFDIARIDEIERETKHDVIAFLTHLAEIVGPGSALRASGHDLVGRARHLPQRPAGARRRYADRRRRCAAQGAEAPGAANTSSRRPSAARTASMPSRPHSGSSSRRPTPNSTAPKRALSRRAPKSRPAPSPARSAPSRKSIRASKRMSRRRWG